MMAKKTGLQTVSGKAFEYAIAKAIEKITRANLKEDKTLDVAVASYKKYPANEKYWINRAADESSLFLFCHDIRFEKATSIHLQNDSAGKNGDVRDIIISIPKDDIGISAKNQHKALKHPRLSSTIDFGKEWTGFPCSETYMESIKPVLYNMQQQKKLGTSFKNISKEEIKLNYYFPILTCFKKEVERLYEDHGQKFAKALFIYLLGKYDFYKIIREKDYVSIQSFNIRGSLEWGKKWKIPNTIDVISFKHKSLNTILVSFTGGWQISFRIHSAKEEFESSLKFDIQFVGLPENIMRHTISLKNKP